MNADIHEGFIRQRRNLIVMSLIVLCIELLGAQFNTLNLLGNKITINNQNIVHTAMWVILIYYLWRYYQYFHDLGDKGFISAVTTKRKQIVGHIESKRFLQSEDICLRQEQDKNGSKAHLRSTVFYKDELTNMDGRIVFMFGNSGLEETADFETHGWALLFPTILAWLHVLIRTTYFSEYILPYVIFSLPVYFLSTSHVSWALSLFASK